MRTQIQRTSRALAQVVSVPAIPQDAMHTITSLSSSMKSIMLATNKAARSPLIEFGQLYMAHNEAMRRAIQLLTQAQIHNVAWINAALDTRPLSDFASIMQAYNRNLASASASSLYPESQNSQWRDWMPSNLYLSIFRQLRRQWVH
jgi:hypothetical protein